MSTESDLGPGADGDDVAGLQQRLKDLDYYTGSVNGYYDDATEDAVRRVQEAGGQEQSGCVDNSTWTEIKRQEAGNSSSYAPAATGPASFDQTSSADRTTDAAAVSTTDGMVSPDGQWLWNGVEWVANTGAAMTSSQGSAPYAADSAEGQLSEDGNWQWVGGQWVAVTPMVAAAAETQTSRSAGSPTQPAKPANQDGTCAKPADITAAEDWIIQRESGWNPNAKNPSSTAFGLGQLLKENRVKYLGDKADSTDCDDQIRAFRAYVKDGYHTAERAQQFWQATSAKDATKAPADLQNKARTWIKNGWVGY